MNGRMREIIIARDGFKCCECQKQFPTTNYFEWEEEQHPMGRLTVDHIWGRAMKRNGVPDERWHMVWTLCWTCHMEKDQGIYKGKARRIGIMYAAQFEGKETEEYLAELAREAIDAEKRKTSKARGRKRQYEHTKTKASGSPLSRRKGKNPMRGRKEKPTSPPGKPPGMTNRDWEQRQRPVFNNNPRPSIHPIPTSHA